MILEQIKTPKQPLDQIANLQCRIAQLEKNKKSIEQQIENTRQMLKRLQGHRSCSK